MQLRYILNEITGNYSVFFDMDGTIVDFDKQVQQNFGMNADQFFDKYDSKDAWAMISEVGGGFWTTMDWMPGAKQVWDFVKKSGCPVSILTAPPKPKNVDMGYIKDVMRWKVQWVRSNLGGVKVLFAYAGEKGKFAKPSHILVDDLEKNLSEWRSKGGIPVHYDNPQSVVKKLKSIGVNA